MKDDMNHPSRWAYRCEHARRSYPPGTRIRLLEMSEDPNPVPAGTCGTVLAMDDAGQLLMRWDNGRSLVWITLRCWNGPGIGTPRREAHTTKETPDEPWF